MLPSSKSKLVMRGTRQLYHQAAKGRTRPASCRAGSTLLFDGRGGLAFVADPVQIIQHPRPSHVFPGAREAERSLEAVRPQDFVRRLLVREVADDLATILLNRDANQ